MATKPRDPGRKRIRLRQVAEMAGVSEATAGAVLRGNARLVRISRATAARVQRAADQLGYQPSLLPKVMQSGKSGSVAILCSSVLAGHDPWLVNAIRQHLTEMGFSVPLYELCYVRDRVPTILADLLSRHVDGLVVTNPVELAKSEAIPVLRKFILNRVPIVLWNPASPPLDELELPYVDPDRVQSYRDATWHLLSLGHTRIGLAVDSTSQILAARARREGYRRAFKEVGLDVDEALWRYEYRDDAPFATYDFEAGYLTAKALWETVRPTAILAANDSSAAGMLKFAHDACLRVPADLSIVGWGDFPVYEYGYMPLTTMHIPFDDAGQWMADTIAQSMEMGRLPAEESRVLTCSLVVRSSTGPPRDQAFGPGR